MDRLIDEISSGVLSAIHREKRKVFNQRACRSHHSLVVFLFSCKRMDEDGADAPI